MQRKQRFCDGLYCDEARPAWPKREGQICTPRKVCSIAVERTMVRNAEPRTLGTTWARLCHRCTGVGGSSGLPSLVAPSHAGVSVTHVAPSWSMSWLAVGA